MRHAQCQTVINHRYKLFLHPIYLVQYLKLNLITSVNPKTIYTYKILRNKASVISLILVKVNVKLYSEQ